MRRIYSQPFVAAFVLAVTLPAAGVKVKPEEFDNNPKDEQIDRGELKVILLHNRSDLWRALDEKEKKGQIKDEWRAFPKEILEKIKDAQARAEDDTTDAVQQLGEKKKSYAIKEVWRYLKRHEPKEGLKLDGVLIRKDPLAVSLTEAPKREEEDTSLNKGDPASFSFARGFGGKGDTWSAEGTVMRPFPLGGANTYLAMVPSVYFQRVTTEKKDDEEVDCLKFGLGALLGTTKGPSRYDSVSLSAGYATDFDFKSGVGTLELDWLPVVGWRPLGVERKHYVGFLSYRSRVILSARYWNCFNAGEKKDLKDNEGEESFQIGPCLRFELWPLQKAFDRLKLTVEWTYWQGLSGEPDHIKYLDAALSLFLDPNFSLEAHYRDGREPDTLDDVEDVTVGLGVKL
jgi:hypothetical protein